MNHLIIGAGQIGTKLAEELVRRKESVTLISRSERTSSPGVRYVQRDALSPETEIFYKEADIIYNCANTPYHTWLTELPPLWRGITHRACQRGKRYLVMTNLYAYGKKEGAFTAGDPWIAHTRKGKIRALLEGETLKKAAAEGTSVSLIRASDYFGSEVEQSSLGIRTLRGVTEGKNPLFTGRLDVPHSYSYAQDVARFLAEVGLSGRQPEQELLVPNAPALTALEITEILEKITGNRLKAKSMGKGTIRLGGLFIPAAREVLEMFYEFESPFVTDTRREERDYSFVPTAMAEALKETTGS